MHIASIHPICFCSFLFVCMPEFIFYQFHLFLRPVLIVWFLLSLHAVQNDIWRRSPSFLWRSCPSSWSIRHCHYLYTMWLEASAWFPFIVGWIFNSHMYSLIAASKATYSATVILLATILFLSWRPTDWSTAVIKDECFSAFAIFSLGRKRQHNHVDRDCVGSCVYDQAIFQSAWFLWRNGWAVTMLPHLLVVVLHSVVVIC